MKVMESCLGEANVKEWMIKTKKAAAKCSGMDAPEIELPMFENTFSLVNTLTSRGPPKDGVDNFERIMEKYMKMQMIRQFTSSEGSPRFLKKRQADENELGERLQEKLLMKKIGMENKIGNMTCFLQECGIMDINQNLDHESIKDMFNKIDIADPWLKSKLVEGCDMCIEFAEGLPEEMAAMCPAGPKLFRAKKFKKCMGMLKMKTCMKFDIKKKLEANFGSVEELVKTTGMEEKYLFAVVHEMLKGPEV
jgi:hypothetical protein